jgi:hypothetical protein
MERVVEDYPRTLAELEARFSSEEACREYLFRLRCDRTFPKSTVAGYQGKILASCLLLAASAAAEKIPTVAKAESAGKR